MFLPEGSQEKPEWPYRTTLEQFGAARINPTGELPAPTQPMEANVVLNAMDGFQMEAADEAILATHPTQLVGHFLVDAAGIVALGADRGTGRPEQSVHLSDSRSSSSPPRSSSGSNGQHRNGSTTSESRSTPALAQTASARMK